MSPSVGPVGRAYTPRTGERVRSLWLPRSSEWVPQWPHPSPWIPPTSTGTGGGLGPCRPSIQPTLPGMFYCIVSTEILKLLIDSFGFILSVVLQPRFQQSRVYSQSLRCVLGKMLSLHTPTFLDSSSGCVSEPLCMTPLMHADCTAGKGALHMGKSMPTFGSCLVQLLVCLEISSPSSYFWFDSGNQIF